ncbi:MAG TPA: hypothetical protein VI168_15205 [Croceibacterium sp.]
MAATGLYSCFDFCLRSEISLNELSPAPEPASRPLVEVRLGPVPEVLPGAQRPYGGIQAAGDAVLLTVRDTARYLVRGGREILVDPFPHAAERNVRLFLLGSALGILVHQRGLLPLHANAVVAGGGAYAFAGHSGAGKSTLAAHFARRGYEVLCDDVCVVGFDEAGVPLAWPGLPRLKLWADAAAAFGHDSASLDRAVEGLDKYHVPLAPTGEQRPVPLRRLYLLARTAGGEAPTIRRVTGQQAMTAVMQQTYRNQYLGPMGLAADHFRLCAALLARIEVYEARRDWGYEVFAREAELLESHISRGP